MKMRKENAQDLLQQINGLGAQQGLEKGQLIQKLFGSVGKKPTVEHNFQCDFGYNIYVGDNFLCNNDCKIVDVAPVTIGDHCFIGPKSKICTAGYSLSSELWGNFMGKAQPVVIGDNVWIGTNSIILPGVTLGNNVVVVANSIVTKSVGSDVIIAGSPAKIIAKRSFSGFKNEQILANYFFSE